MEILKLKIESVICVGDLHGNFGSLIQLLKSYDIKNTLLIICGDVGMGFHKSDYYEQVFSKIKKELSKRDSYIYCIRGNHDDPNMFNSDSFKDNRMRTLRDYTVIQCIDPNDENIFSNILAIGGATSIDRTDRLYSMQAKTLKYLRFHPNALYREAEKQYVEYWDNEQPVYDDKALSELKENGVFIDIVCTHTCPHFCKPITKEGIQHWILADEHLSADLDHERQTMTNIYERLKTDGHIIKKWIYGHYHFHNMEYINDTQFTLLDMERNGIFDHIEILRYA